MATFRSNSTPHPVDTLLKGVEIAKKRSYIPPGRDFCRTGISAEPESAPEPLPYGTFSATSRGISRTDTLGQPASPFRTDTREDTGPAQR